MNNVKKENSVKVWKQCERESKAELWNNSYRWWKWWSV